MTVSAGGTTHPTGNRRASMEDDNHAGAGNTPRVRQGRGYLRISAVHDRHRRLALDAESHIPRLLYCFGVTLYAWDLPRCAGLRMLRFALGSKAESDIP